MRKPLLVTFLALLSFSTTVLAESYLGQNPGMIIKTGPRHGKKHSPIIEAIPVQAFQRAKGHRPAHRNYDLDLTTGDDNPYVSPDLQIN